MMLAQYCQWMLKAVRVGAVAVLWDHLDPEAKDNVLIALAGNFEAANSNWVLFPTIEVRCICKYGGNCLFAKLQLHVVVYFFSRRGFVLCNIKNTLQYPFCSFLHAVSTSSGSLLSSSSLDVTNLYPNSFSHKKMSFGFNPCRSMSLGVISIMIIPTSALDNHFRPPFST
mgnify:CR=1 FL=1